MHVNRLQAKKNYTRQSECSWVFFGLRDKVKLFDRTSQQILTSEITYFGQMRAKIGFLRLYADCNTWIKVQMLHLTLCTRSRHFDLLAQLFK